MKEMDYWLGTIPSVRKGFLLQNMECQDIQEQDLVMVALALDRDPPLSLEHLDQGKRPEPGEPSP